VELVRRLGPDQPAYGFQSPGLTDGAPRLTRIEDMAARYIDAMRVVQPRGPYRIAGWSFGGLLAFEMARQLAGAGDSVEFLAFIDTGVLDTRDRRARNLLRLTLLQLMPLVFLLHVKPPTSYAGLKRLASWVGIGMPETRQEFFRRRDGHGARPLRRFVAGARRSLRVFFANLTASRRYVPSNYPGRVVVFRARRRLSPRDPFVEGSRKFAAGGVSVTLVEGNHMTVVLDPGRAGELAAHIRRALDAVPARERLATLSR
jgi:thioesterase domain-containing protein